jgi:hypothetical protein
MTPAIVSDSLRVGMTAAVVAVINLSRLRRERSMVRSTEGEGDRVGTLLSRGVKKAAC